MPKLVNPVRKTKPLLFMGGCTICVLVLNIQKFAYADYISYIIKCAKSKNAELVVFGKTTYKAPISQFRRFPILQSIPKGFRSYKFQHGPSCTLSDGNVINISISTSKFSYGLNGGDMDIYFSLTLNGKNIYNKKEFYHGHGKDIIKISGLFYTNKKFHLFFYNKVDPAY